MSQISEDAIRATLATVREQLTEEITEAIEKAVREERKATVAFLRQAGDMFADVRDCIERGEHRRKEEE
jgi:hypothetical protein